LKNKSIFFNSLLSEEPVGSRAWRLLKGFVDAVTLIRPEVAGVSEKKI
jgi:hypothetical protein